MASEPRGAEPLPPEVAERYADAQVIGQGGMGVVYRARDVKLDRTVALKCVRVDLAGSKSLQTRFRRELDAMARISHPNVVRLLDCHEAGARAVIAMEFVEGSTLKALLRAGPLAPVEAVEFLAQACDGVAALHGAGILHRDLKPSNLMVAPGPRVLVMDLGLVKLEEGPGLTALTKTGQLLGTALYLAPEVMLGAAPDRRSDVYQLGLVLYEALTGSYPLKAFRSDQIASGAAFAALPRPSSVSPGADAGLDRIVLAAVAARPEARLPSAEALAQELRRWLALAPSRQVSAVAPAGREPRPAAGARRATVVAALATAAAVGALAWLRPPPPPPPPSYRNLSLEVAAPRLLVDYVTDHPMRTEVRWRDGGGPWRSAAAGATPTTVHRLTLTPVAQDSRCQVAVRYPDGSESLPVSVSTHYPIRSLAVEPQRDRGLLLRWGTDGPAACEAAAATTDGGWWRLEVFSDKAGSKHLAKLDAWPLPSTVGLRLEARQGPEVVVRHELDLGPAELLRTLLDGYGPAARLSERLARDSLGGRRSPLEVEVDADPATAGLADLLDGLAQAAPRFLADRSVPFARRAAFYRDLTTCRLLASYAATPAARSGLEAAAALHQGFVTGRLLGVAEYDEAVRQAVWRHEYPVNTFFNPCNFEDAYARSIAIIIKAQLLSPAEERRSDLVAALPAPSGRGRPWRLLVRLCNLDVAVVLRVTLGEQLPLFLRGTPHEDILAAVHRETPVNFVAPTVKSRDWEQLTPPAYWAWDLPEGALQPGENRVTVEALALRATSKWVPSVRALHLCPR